MSSNAKMESIGSRIRKRREELGISQVELAKRMGYRSRSSISKIESEERNIPQQKIIEIATVLNTTPSYLMGFKNEWLNYDDYTEDERKEIKSFANYLILKRKDDKK